MKKSLLLKLLLCLMLMSISLVCFTACGGIGSNNNQNVSQNGGNNEENDSENENNEDQDDENNEDQDDENNSDTEELEDIVGVSFEGLTVDYDGNPKTIAVTGVLSTDEVIYSGLNTQTNAGTYNITATIKRAGHKDLILQAVLKINKAEITGVVFDDCEFVHDGQAKSILVNEETLPNGVVVEYAGNDQIEVGEYLVTATISGANYVTKTISATLKIKASISQFIESAQNIIDKLLKKADPWAFLPEALALENLKENSVQPIDFSQGFVNVSSIPQNGIGKQLNVMYSILTKMEAATNYVNKVKSVASTLVTVYQKFLNDNPEDYAVFEKQMDIFDLKIELDGKNYTLLARFATVAVELYYNADEGVNSARVQLNETTAIYYSFSEDKIDINVKAVGVFAGSLSLEREEDTVKGRLVEFYGTENVNIKTSAIIDVNEEYTTVISNKRETDDLLIEGYVEVYDSETGCLVGAEVKETVKKKDYDTMWFNLCDVSGINSVKVLPVQNFMNSNTVYINGSSTSLHSKNVSLLNASRRFDIEMKEMYFYVYNQTSEEFEKVVMEIPMLFVQRENLSTFGEDFYDENSSSGCETIPSITLGEQKIEYVNSIYETLLEEFLALKEEFLYSDIISAIGNKNSFFG